MNKEVNTPWVCLDPPTTEDNLNKKGIAQLPLDNYLNIRFHALLATGPKKPRDTRKAKVFTEQMK